MKKMSTHLAWLLIAAFVLSTPGTLTAMDEGKTKQNELDQKLMKAARKRKQEDVKRLLEAGANAKFTDEYGYTPLHWATMFAHHGEITKLLLAFKADPNAANVDGDTPVIFAIRNRLNITRNTDILDLLLTNNAKVNATDDNGAMPLHIAASQGRKEFVVLLLEHGAKKYVNTADKQGNTPLHYAGRSGNTDVESLLIKYGADETIPNDEGLAMENFTGWRERS